MTVSDVLKKYPIDTKIFVIKKIKIHWSSIRFDNTNITPATFVIAYDQNQSFFNSLTILKLIDSPLGTKSYHTRLTGHADEYECFKTQEEAEIWKIMELQTLEQLVNDHIDSIKIKTEKKLKAIKTKEKLDEYIQKYPDLVLKVM